MERWRKPIKNILWMLLILIAAFLLVVTAQHFFDTRSIAPMVFVLAVFVISLTTEGYVCGILASLIGVLAVNFAFTFPYFEFNFSIPVNLFSAVVMLCVAIATNTLTVKNRNQEKIKAENEKERVRTGLLRAISHDLRTPLTTIYGSCSAIMENYDLLTKDQQLKLLREISEDAQWLIRMVENLLSATRIDTDRVTINKVPTVLEELIDTVLVTFKKRFPTQGVQVEIPDGFISIPMDAMLIEQVIVNLLENAVYHAKGMTELSLRVRPVDGWAVFEVADNGCGIPEDSLNRIFSGSSTQQSLPLDGGKHNMGLGLSVCSAIVKAHGGKITAENRKGGGALFRFTLEMEAMEHEQ